MASSLLRTPILRGTAFRRTLSAAAGAGEEGLGASRVVWPRRRSISRAPTDHRPPRSLEEKVTLLHQNLKELDSTLEKRYLIYASLQKLVAEKKLLNPFVQWSWQVGAAALFVFAERALCGSGTEDN